MNMLLTALLWVGYLALVFMLSLPGVNLGFLLALGIAIVWTAVIEGLRMLLVQKPKNRP